MSLLEKLFGGNKQAVSKLSREVEKINALEAATKGLSEQAIREKIDAWKKQLNGLQAKEQNIILDGILAEVFALTREVARRTIGQRHFDVQLIGGIALHKGQIAEMKTGEGKTLTATLPIVLNALTGRGVHLVTVNDYLARWHASLMGPIYHGLGLSIASIQHEKSFLFDPNYEPDQAEILQIESETQGLVLDVKHMRAISRRQAYAADITYGTNNEFGFDYLRDNMVPDLAMMTQRGHAFAIVDEVDSILIDEARTPLIISAPDAEPTDKYYHFAKLVEKLEAGVDYTLDEKKKAAPLTETGIEKLEKLLGVKNIYEQEGLNTVHHLEQAVTARANYLRDKDYVVRDDEVVIVDEFTGRLMFGRRYSHGLHQAIEAKEGVKIQQESKTLATITFQNYFRMYKKLAGMTGTALTEAEEFFKIYKLEVVEIPTHRPMVRKDATDSVYKSEAGKFTAIVREVKERHLKGQPILIGTVSIQKNELLAEHLKKAGLKFELLNAKNHEREAHIISQAGRLGAITVATNIAGRGVDILLGGNPVDPDEAAQIITAGGLHVIGTERHESRRIDNQLRGRSGRQGDPGSTQFYVSVDDDLMRLFGGARLKGLMEKMGIAEDQPIEHSMVSKSIEQAQKKIEGLNFDTRKHVLEYDDIMNKQREVIYKKRLDWLDAKEDLGAQIQALVSKEIDVVVKESSLADADADQLLNNLNAIFPFTKEEAEEMSSIVRQAGDAEFAITDHAQKLAAKRFDEKEAGIKQMGAADPNILRQLYRYVCLQSLDNLWMEHLDTMDHLRDSVGLRGYGQRDPLVEYKRESFELFKRLLKDIDKQVVYSVYKVGFMPNPPQTDLEIAAAKSSSVQSQEDSDPNAVGVGRNDPCFCGSGKKYKKCGLVNTEEHRNNMAKKN